MKIKEFGIFLVLSVGIFATAWAIKGNLYPTIVDNTVTDTVFVDVPYEVEIIKKVEVPVRYTEYVTEYDTIETVQIVNDTVFVRVPDRTITYNSKFLTNFPTRPKLLGINKENGLLSVTGLTVNGETKEKTWKIDNKNYRIGSDGNDFVNIETFPPDRDLFNWEVESGWLKSLNYSSLYLQGEVNFSILTTTVNINKEPFVLVGVKYGNN